MAAGEKGQHMDGTSLTRLAEEQLAALGDAAFLPTAAKGTPQAVRP